MEGERVVERGGERGEGGVIRVDEKRKSGGDRWREREGSSNKGGNFK